jgi:hypothetical protein
VATLFRGENRLVADFTPVRTGVQAARRIAGAVATAAASKRTEIRFYTPDSSMVTP